MLSTAAVRARARHLSRQVLRRAAPRLGYDILEHSYYSPIPDVSALPSTLWTQPSELRGIDFDPAAQLAFVVEELGVHIEEFKPPRERPTGPVTFHLHNRMYESVDAELLYAMVRHLRPRRVVELGSGYSSLALGEALARNRDEGVGSEYRLFDPFFREELEEGLRRVANVAAIGATAVPLEEFEALDAGDILFVDTTHTVKAGGDVNFIVLDVLPLLRPGVVVHFHDIFLPWEYPRDWLVGRERFWAEQYLLQAFLMHNEAWTVLVGAHAVARAFPDELGRVIPSFHRGVAPGALWLRNGPALG